MVRNSTSAWGSPAKLFHWIGAIAILVLIGYGWWMTHMVERAERPANYAWHAALGYDLLALLVLRLLWRWMNTTPELPNDMQPWERRAAHTGHIGLYVLMFGAALLGWALAGTFQTPYTADLLGTSFPRIVAATARPMHELFENTHLIISYLLGVLVVVHIGAALRHHYVKHNDVLRRMGFGA